MRVLPNVKVASITVRLLESVELPLMISMDASMDYNENEVLAPLTSICAVIPSLF